MCNFKTRLEARGYPKSLIEKTLSEVSFAARQPTLKKKTKNLKAKYCLLWQHTTQGLKKFKTNTDARMEPHPKSATAENNLQNASGYIIQKR